MARQINEWLLQERDNGPDGVGVCNIYGYTGTETRVFQEEEETGNKWR